MDIARRAVQPGSTATGALMPNDPESRVLFAEMFVAVPRAIGATPVVFLLAWIARFAVMALATGLRPMHPSPPPAFASWAFVMLLVPGFTTTLISGLFIRALLEPRRRIPNLDLRLAAYVALVSISRFPSWVPVSIRLPPATESVSQGVVRLGLFAGGSLIFGLVMAALALWPIAVLMGVRLSPARAVRLMAPALVPWILAVIILALPELALPFVLMPLHPFQQGVGLGLGLRIGLLILSSFLSTISAVALTYVYARRVQAANLSGTGSAPLLAFD